MKKNKSALLLIASITHCIGVYAAVPQYWTNIISAPEGRIFSGVNVYGGIDDPSISGDGSLVTVRNNPEGKLININYSNPNSPNVVDITPKKMYPPFADTAYPMAMSAYIDKNGQYTSAIFGPKIKPGIVKVNPSANSYNNIFSIYDTSSDAGITQDINRDGTNIVFMRRSYIKNTYKYDVYISPAPSKLIIDYPTAKLLSNTLSVENESSNGNSMYPRISGSGQYVVYESNSSNIVKNDKNYRKDIFVANSTIQRTSSDRNELISLTMDNPNKQANDASGSPAISEDGRFIVYMTSATNLTSEKTAGIILHDRVLKTNKLISKKSDGTSAIDFSNPGISYDGRFVLFESMDPRITDIETIGNNAYVYDTKTEITKLVSNSLADKSANLTASKSRISANGDYVVFMSGGSVYRVENPLMTHDEIAATVLGDDKDDIVKVLSQGTGYNFMYPIKIINKTAATKKVGIKLSLFHVDGTNETQYKEIHVCDNTYQDLTKASQCDGGILTYTINPNKNSPTYLTYPVIDIKPEWPNGRWKVKYEISDVDNNLTTEHLMYFNKK